MLILIFILLLLVYLLFWYINYIKKYRDIEKLPGPSIKEILSVYSGKSEGLFNFLQSLNKNFGPIAKIWIKPMSPIIMTTDLEFVDKIYKSNEFFYTPTFADLSTLFRNGLVTTKSRESWNNDKHILNKVLTPRYISDSLVIYNKKYDEFIEEIYENLEKPYELESNLYRIHAVIIIESMVGTKIKMTPKEMDEYIKNRYKYMNLLLEKLNSSNIIFYKFTTKYKESLKSANKVIEIMKNILERHKENFENQKERNNLIYALLENGMPDDRIVDNMNTLIAAAFETSALPMSLTLYELAKRPELQEKILEEILSIVGPPSPKQISLNDLNNMTYLNCVINETLRLFFPSPFLDRLVTQDVRVKDMLIPKGTQVIFYMPEVFKSEEVFKNANVFNPDRFLPENTTENVKKVFIPFGYGDKTCAGRKIASASMKLFLVKILREFKIYLVKDQKMEFKSDIMFRSVNGVYVIFQKRMY